MDHVIGLRCVICGELYPADPERYVCPKHGADGVLDVEYDYERVQRTFAMTEARPENGMFAYRPFLPVEIDTVEPPLLVGATPLYDAPRIAAAAGVARVMIKDEGRNPTGSLKDRASALAVMKAREAGSRIVTTASTGNAAAALAGLAASTGQQSVIFVPASAPKAKIAQLMVYGATVLLVDGSYDDAFELCLEATAEFGWYCRNTAYNPYMAEGKKTAVFELYDQLRLSIRRWNVSNQQSMANLKAPISHIFVSVGDGCIISGVYKGLKDMQAVGLLDEMPQLFGVQAAGSSYLYDAWRNDEDVVSKPAMAAHSVADSIVAGLPRDRVKAMTAVRESKGAFVQVTDDEILQAIPALAQQSGVFAEPAAAAAYAGLLKATQEQLVSPEAKVVLLLTGNGLKDINSAMKSVGKVLRIKPQLTAVRQALAILNKT